MIASGPWTPPATQTPSAGQATLLSSGRVSTGSTSLPATTSVQRIRSVPSDVRTSPPPPTAVHSPPGLHPTASSAWEGSALVYLQAQRSWPSVSVIVPRMRKSRVVATHTAGSVRPRRHATDVALSGNALWCQSVTAPSNVVYTTPSLIPTQMSAVMQVSASVRFGSTSVGWRAAKVVRSVVCSVSVLPRNRQVDSPVQLIDLMLSPEYPLSGSDHSSPAATVSGDRDCPR